MCFSNCGKFLISAGVPEEGTIAVFDVESGLVIKSTAVKSGAIAALAVDPYIAAGNLQFTTVGANGSMMLWRMDETADQLQYYEVEVPSAVSKQHLVSLCYGEQMAGSYNTYLTMIGTSDGSLVGFDNKSNQFVHAGQKQAVLRGQIGQIIANADSIVLGSSGGCIARYFMKTPDTEYNPFPHHNLKIFNLDGAVSAVSMDDQNCEGLIGTENGSIYYINFDEKILLKLVVTHHGKISSLKFGLSEQGASELLLSASEGGVTIRAAQTLDQVLHFKTKINVALVMQCPTDLKKSIFVHENGLVQFVSLNRLKIEGVLKLSLQEGEKITSGSFNSNGVNFAIGTSQGSIVFAKIQEAAWISPLRASISIVNDV